MCVSVSTYTKWRKARDLPCRIDYFRSLVVLSKRGKALNFKRPLKYYSTGLGCRCSNFERVAQDALT